MIVDRIYFNKKKPKNNEKIKKYRLLNLIFPPLWELPLNSNIWRHTIHSRLFYQHNIIMFVLNDKFKKICNNIDLRSFVHLWLIAKLQTMQRHTEHGRWNLRAEGKCRRNLHVVMDIVDRCQVLEKTVAVVI